MSSAWVESEQGEIKESDKKFEDNFVSKQFEPLEDSSDYLKLLGELHVLLLSAYNSHFSLESRLNKIKKDPSVLKQLQQKREECLQNLLNNSISIRSDQDLELEESVQTNRIISHLIPAQPQTIGEITHLLRHDELDLQKQETEESAENP
jgi:hypothetical protein